MAMKLLKRPAIQAVLDVNIRHISFEDSKHLHDDAQKSLVLASRPRLVVYEYDRGFFVHVNTDPDTPLDEAKLRETYSGALVRLLALTKAHHCRFLRVDGDGTDYDNELEVFEWP